MNSGYKKIDNYLLDMSETLGKGQYGSVYKGYYYLEEESVGGGDITLAIKETPVFLGNEEDAQAKKQTAVQEINFLKEINHPNIIKFIDAKYTSNNIYLVMEYCNQGDLSHFLLQRLKQVPNHQLDEMEVLNYFRDIIDAFRYLRKNDILHRDIKTQNILVHDGVLKLADFGFSRKIGDGDSMKTQTGTPLFQDPNIVDENYNSKSDIFSLGILLWHMLYVDINQPNGPASFPWYKNSLYQLSMAMKSIPVRFPDKPTRPVSKVTKDLIEKMLIINLEQRIGWEDLFNHPLLQSKVEESMVKNEKEDGKHEVNYKLKDLEVKNYSIIDLNMEQERPENQTIRFNKNRENKMEQMQPVVQKLNNEKAMIYFVFDTASKLGNIIFPNQNISFSLRYLCLHVLFKKCYIKQKMLHEILANKVNNFGFQKNSWHAFLGDRDVYSRWLQEVEKNLDNCTMNFKIFLQKAQKKYPNDPNINDSDSLKVFFSQSVIEKVLKALIPSIYELQNKILQQMEQKLKEQQKQQEKNNKNNNLNQNFEFSSYDIVLIDQVYNLFIIYSQNQFRDEKIFNFKEFSDQRKIVNKAFFFSRIVQAYRKFDYFKDVEI